MDRYTALVSQAAFVRSAETRMKGHLALWVGLSLWGMSCGSARCDETDRGVAVYKIFAKPEIHAKELREIGFFAAHPATRRYVYRWTTDPQVYASIEGSKTVPRGTKLFTAAYDGVRWWRCRHSLSDPKVVTAILIDDSEPDSRVRHIQMRGRVPQRPVEPWPYAFPVLAPLNLAAGYLDQPSRDPTCFAKPVLRDFPSPSANPASFELKPPKGSQSSGVLSGELGADGRIESMKWRANGGGSGGPRPWYLTVGCEFRRDLEEMPLETFEEVVDLRWSLDAALEVWFAPGPTRQDSTSPDRPKVIYAGRAIDQFVSR